MAGKQQNGVFDRVCVKKCHEGPDGPLGQGLDIGEKACML